MGAYMTKQALQLMLMFLDEYIDVMGDSSCNDFDWPSEIDKDKFLNDYPMTDDQLEQSGFDFVVANHLANIIMEEIENAPESMV